jgi:hypothetical protein
LLTITGDSFSTKEGVAPSAFGVLEVSTLLTGMVLGSVFDEVGMGIPALLLDLRLFF